MEKPRYVYIKAVTRENGQNKEVQFLCKVLNENEYGDVVLEININGKIENRCFRYDEYSDEPFILDIIK